MTTGGAFPLWGFRDNRRYEEEKWTSNRIVFLRTSFSELTRVCFSVSSRIEPTTVRTFSETRDSRENIQRARNIHYSWYLPK